MSPPAESGPHRAGPIRMLRRSRTDRKLAGVCGGLGAYTNVDPLIYRVLFAVFSLFGGFGLLLYGAAWLIIPEDGQDRSEGQRLLQGHGTSTATAGAIAVTVLGFVLFLAIANDQWNVVLWIIVITVIAYFVVRSRYPTSASSVGAWWQSESPPTTTRPAADSAPEAPGSAAATSAPTAPAGQGAVPPEPPAPPQAAEPRKPLAPKEPPSATGWLALSAALVVAGVLVSFDIADVVSVPTAVVLASCLVVIGLGLVVATWYGRARSLILVGIVVMVALALVAALGTTFRGRVGELEVTPATVSDLDNQPYEVAMGSMVIDLRDLDPVVPGTVIEAQVGMGNLEVIYPDDIRVIATADVHVGAVETHNSDDARVSGDDVVIVPSDPSRGTIRLDLEVGMGQIEFSEGNRR